MTVGRIDYQLEKYQFSSADESPRLTRQWADVLEECRQLKAGAEERLRIALLNVDYVTSFELPFRLLLIRTPQLIAGLRDELQLSQKNVIFNGKRFGCVWSLKSDLSAIPDEFQYRMITRIRRVDPAGVTATLYQQLAKEVKAPRERLRLALESGLQVTALDGLFWFGTQRIAADVQRLRKAGMAIATSEADVFDNLTGTTRIGFLLVSDVSVLALCYLPARACGGCGGSH
ncbi:DNA-binding protein [Enterobacter ludwigii]|uniref:DNA-binding protein n=1 Tax=Enterobacter ludwigii TaxID=299767 RepID=UPI003BEF3C80